MGYSPHAILAVKLFEGLDPIDCLALFETAKRVAVPADQIILKEGEMSGDVFAILNGSVFVTKSNRGRAEHLATLTAGDCFGEMALLEGKSRSATITAREPSILLEFEMTSLEKLFEKNHRLAAQVFQNLARIVSSRLRQIQEKS